MNNLLFNNLSYNQGDHDFRQFVFLISGSRKTQQRNFLISFLEYLGTH